MKPCLPTPFINGLNDPHGEVILDTTTLAIEGVSQESLEKSINKMNEVAEWSDKEKIDRWAYRAALLKALYDDADKYFASGEGSFREIAAFDNGVATALKKLKNGQTK